MILDSRRQRKARSHCEISFHLKSEKKKDNLSMQKKTKQNQPNQNKKTKVKNNSTSLFHMKPCMSRMKMPISVY